MNTNTNAHRETWLNRLAALMAPKFEELGHPVPALRIAIGFTGSAREKEVAGVCWHKSASADQHFEIFISPDQADPIRVAGVLAHEMTHAAVGFEHKHRGPFAKVCKALGLEGPMTATTEGPAFIEWVKPFLDLLGPLPHAPLMFRHSGGARRKPDEETDGSEGEGEAGGSSNDKPKQSTRLLKACCQHEGCGYTVRLSRKWALKLGAVCPEHGAMEVEGLDDGQQEGEEE